MVLRVHLDYLLNFFNVSIQCLASKGTCQTVNKMPISTVRFCSTRSNVGTYTNPNTFFLGCVIKSITKGIKLTDIKAKNLKNQCHSYISIVFATVESRGRMCLVGPSRALFLVLGGIWGHAPTPTNQKSWKRIILHLQMKDRISRHTKTLFESHFTKSLRG